MNDLIVGAGLIDRRKAVNEIDRFAGYLDNDMIYRIKYALCEIHIADGQEIVHGRWVGFPECLKYPNAYADDHIVCSACEECFSVLDNCTERFDYCPHCGAIMDLEDTE